MLDIDLIAPMDQTQLLLLAMIFASVLMLVVGAVAALTGNGAEELRFEEPGPRVAKAGLPLRNDEAGSPAGVQRFVMPHDVQERSRVRGILFQAGYRGRHALRNYYYLRTGLGLLLPAPLIVAALALPFTIGQTTFQPPLDLSGMSMLILVAILVAAGFYGPLLWVRRRIAARVQAVREGFPNALALMQVAVEAGLGFESALARVGEELALAQPVLADEFALVGLEFRAGKPREQVLSEFAIRTGVEEVGSFVAVINQSMRFGTNIADALEVFSTEMRHKRMMAAEEMANKLPVKMSGVLVLFMLPAVMTVCLGPVIIRAIRVIAPALN